MLINTSVGTFVLKFAYFNDERGREVSQAYCYPLGSNGDSVSAQVVKHPSDQPNRVQARMLLVKRIVEALDFTSPQWENEFLISFYTQARTGNPYWEGKRFEIAFEKSYQKFMARQASTVIKSDNSDV